MIVRALPMSHHRLLFPLRNDQNLGYILANILFGTARWYAKSSQSD